MDNSILKREIRFAVHLPAYKRDEDLHYIKEQITYTDGRKEPKITLIKDFKRPVWLTHRKFRNHKEKKEFEDNDKLIKLESTQTNLNYTIAKALEQPHMASNLEFIKGSPYVYGYDITSTSYLKFINLSKNNFIQSPYSIAAFDIETGIRSKEVIMATIAMPGKAYTAILKSVVETSGDVPARVSTALNVYLPRYKDLDYKVEVFDNEVKLLYHIFKIATEWAPDFMMIWNMDYDIPFILNRLRMLGVDPIDILADHNLPRELRYCRYKQGIKKKVTASGVVKPINPSMQWHSLVLTAPFYVIDSMCVYRQLRLAQQEEPSYSLDNILKKELKTQKLTFTEADHLSGVAWHEFMQDNYPIEYTIYNVYDCLSMLELDAKIKDVSSALPVFAGITDFNRFNSNPKKIVDALFKFGLEKGRIIGTVAKYQEESEDTEIDDELDEMDVSNFNTLDLKNWIITLPQHLLYSDGLRCIEENPNIVTNIRALVMDQDVTSAYPNATLVSNVSKETTENEIAEIPSIKENVFREQNLGFIVGKVNVLEYCSVMLSLPTLEDLDALDIYTKE